MSVSTEERLAPATCWTALGFIAGSFLFALGVFPPYAHNVDPRVDGVTFFIGSLFFTYAGYLQIALSLNAEPGRPWRRVGARAQLDRLVGRGGAIRRYAALQRQHVQRADLPSGDAAAAAAASGRRTCGARSRS